MDAFYDANVGKQAEDKQTVDKQYRFVNYDVY